MRPVGAFFISKGTQVNIFEITLDVDKRSNKESVNLRQGDINGTTIRATLRDHDVPMEGGNYTAMFCMTLPDRKTFYHDDATYENGVVTVVVQEQYAAAVPGFTNNAYFELYDGEELKYTTASFMVRVKPSAMDGEAAQSYDPRVEALMSEMRDLIDDETVAEEGRVAAESARATAEQGRVNTFADNEAQRSETFETNEGLRAAAFTANEAQRSEAFETSESLRAATFVETEGARSVRFLDNEDDRQAQYEESMSAWTLAETSRADTFAANEAARQSTFETNEAARTEAFNAFASPTVAVEETSTGQVAHITWSDPSGVHVSDMVIDDAINVAMTGDTLSIPVDTSGTCVESGIARFYFSGWVGDRMVPCSATITSTADPRFTVRITNSTAIEHGLIRVEYLEGTTYPAQLDVCTVSITCSGRTFLHRISAVAPRGGVAIDGVDGRDGADGLSPTVSIASTSSEHTVTITDVSGEHSYEVPTYANEEAARASAESDRAAAESARATAESSRVTAELARESAETQRDATVTAISDKIDALTARGPSNETSFLYRVTNDGNGISGKAAAITSIHGRTLRWNQLYSHTNCATSTKNGVTLTNNSDGSFTISGTASAQTDFRWNTSANYTFKANHRYLVRMCPAGGSVSTYESTDTWSNQFTDTGSGYIKVVGNADKVVQPVLRIANGATINAINFHPMFFDLTAMFGAGNEPSTVAEFEALYPASYYRYDARSLLPVNMTGIETKGFNQWDEEWEVGDISGTGSTGGQVISGNYLMSKNYIPVFPSTDYCISSTNEQGTNSRRFIVYFYDKNKAFITYTSFAYLVNTFTIPSNCYFIKFRNNKVSATYSHDICINLSDSTRNGTYWPHWQGERSIPAGILRGAGSVFDELTDTKRITRIGEVDLGTLNWTYNAAKAVFYVNFTQAARTGNLTCSKYDTSTVSRVEDMPDKTIWNVGYAFTANNIVVKDTAYTDAATFKAAMSGVMLHYELATPTATPYDPPLNLTYRTETGGTERVMVPTGEQSAPPVMQLSYDVSVIDGLITMPEDYISHASFAAFCAALEQAANLTITETWDETAQAYSYNIVSGS